MSEEEGPKDEALDAVTRREQRTFSKPRRAEPWGLKVGQVCSICGAPTAGFAEPTWVFHGPNDVGECGQYRATREALQDSHVEIGVLTLRCLRAGSGASQEWPDGE